MSDTTESKPANAEPKSAPEPIPQRKLYPLPEGRVLLGGISTATIYRLAAAGKLKLTKIGDRSFISEVEIKRLSA